jgi:hypothetical protein
LEKAAESGRGQSGNGRRQEDELIGSETKYHRTEADIYSIKCRIGGEAGGYSGVSGGRRHAAEAAIRKKNGWLRFIVSRSEKRE